MTDIYDIEIQKQDGSLQKMSDYKGKILLIVNTATGCGFTPQYKGLEEMYEEMKDQMVVLGFPCNQFGAQEPGDARAIGAFCALTYDVTFPVLAKVAVNGADAEKAYKGFLEFKDVVEKKLLIVSGVVLISPKCGCVVVLPTGDGFFHCHSFSQSPLSLKQVRNQVAAAGAPATVPTGDKIGVAAKALSDASYPFLKEVQGY